VPTVRELAERGGRGALSSCRDLGSLAEIRCRFSADQSVKDIRVEVGAVRPADRAKLRVDPNAGEYLGSHSGAKTPTNGTTVETSISPSAPSSKRSLR
jgi:hypothetical protein